jgi:hypothetical protein
MVNNTVQSCGEKFLSTFNFVTFDYCREFQRSSKYIVGNLITLQSPHCSKSLSFLYTLNVRHIEKKKVLYEQFKS